MFETLALVIVGFIVGLFSGLFGIGGGSIIIPVLVIFFGVDIKVAIGTSLLIILPTAITAAYKHYVDGKVNVKLGLILGITGIGFAVLGSFIANSIQSLILEKLFGLFLVVTSIQIIAIRNVEGSGHASLIKTILVGAVGGVLAGLLGIGGGGVLVPLLIVVLGMSAHMAVGTSLLAIVFNAIGGSVGHLAVGNFSIDLVITLLVGLVAGAYTGAAIGDRVPERELKIAVGIFLGLIGISLLLY